MHLLNRFFIGSIFWIGMLIPEMIAQSNGDYYLYHEQNGLKRYWVVADDGSGEIQLLLDGKNRFKEAATFTIFSPSTNSWTIKSRKEEKYVGFTYSGVGLVEGIPSFYHMGVGKSKLLRSKTSFLFLGAGSNNRLVQKNWEGEGEALVFGWETADAGLSGNIELEGQEANQSDILREQSEFWNVEGAEDKGCQGNFRIYHVPCQARNGDSNTLSDKCLDMVRGDFKGQQMLADPVRLEDRTLTEVRILCE